MERKRLKWLITQDPKKISYYPASCAGLTSLTFLFLLIEFFDELNYGIGNAALPAIRTDLGITYLQVGLLLGLPGILNTFIEPVLMLLGDTRFRKHIMLGGGLAIILSLVAHCWHTVLRVGTAGDGNRLSSQWRLRFTFPGDPDGPKPRA